MPSEHHLPLTESAFEILLALLDGEKHGYAILQSVTKRTRGRLKMHAGTLYRALARMLDEGWLEELAGQPDDAGDERRRYYRITDTGRTAARAEARRLASQLAAARAHRLISDA